MHTASVVTLGMGNKNYTFFRLFQSMLQTHKKRIMHTRHSYTLRSPCPGNFHHHYQPPAVATFCFYRSLSKPQETIIHKRFKPFVLGRNSQVGRNVWKGRIDFLFVVERLSQKYRQQCCQHCQVQKKTNVISGAVHRIASKAATVGLKIASELSFLCHRRQFWIGMMI